jgi:hypothetical protein
VVNLIKKVNVPPSLLAELDWESGGYLIRYRIISESRNTRSHWSPVYSLSLPDFEEVDGSISEGVASTGRPVLTATWENEYKLASHDIFVAFGGALTIDPIIYDGDNFIYQERVSANSYNFTFNPEASYARIIVQPASNKQLIKSSFVIFDETYFLES